MKRAGKKIALLSGDGIGPEVIRESVKVLATLSSNSDINFSYYDAPIGAEAIDNMGALSLIKQKKYAIVVTQFCLER